MFVCFRYAVLPGPVCLEKGQNYTVRISFPQYSSYSYHSSPRTLVDSVSVFHLYINYMYNSFRIKNINLRIMYKSSGQIELFFMNNFFFFYVMVMAFHLPLVITKQTIYNF